ncbi:TPA: hypothetical protein QDB21_005628 [Burkholderia vietnamiensis]|nr:hypothetical protein [Burkholderia vietnamiensis]
MSKQTHPWTLVDPQCGGAAFHRVSIPHSTDPILAHHVEHIDGRPAHPMDIFGCDGCGRPFGPDELRAGLMTNPDNWRMRT